MPAATDSEVSVGAANLVSNCCGTTMSCIVWTSVRGSVTLIRNVTNTIKNAVSGSSASSYNKSYGVL